MDIYAQITDRIIAEMEGGVIPWKKPWVGSDNAVSYASGKPYSLLNQMLLGEPGEYLTFNECRKAGGYVRKGEKAKMVVFWTWLEREDEDGEKKEIPFLRYYNVFHIRQCEGLEVKYIKLLPHGAAEDRTADTIIRGYTTRENVQFHHSEGNRAFYCPTDDCITVPTIAQFSNTAEYYSTVFHELVHSTGHSQRLNRMDKTAFFGSEAYSKEELVAEIGAAVLVNCAGLETASSFRNNAAYIQNWLSVLKNDKRFIVSAAGKAEKAVRWILG